MTYLCFFAQYYHLPKNAGGIIDKDMSKLQNERYEEEQNEENVSNTL